MSEKKFTYFQPPDPNKPAEPVKEFEPLIPYDDDDDGGIMSLLKWKMKNSPFFPLVPIGVIGLLGSFFYGMGYGFLRNDPKANIRGMSGRVGFQTLVIIALVGDFYWDVHKKRIMIAKKE